MKFRSGLLLAWLMTASLVSAENLTQANMEKAQAVIDAAVEAYGGADRLSGIQSVVVMHETVNIATGQSKAAEPPWDRNESSGTTAIDLENGAFATRNAGTGGGFEFNNGTIINGDESYQLNFRAGTIAKIAEPDFDTTSGPFMRVTPAMLVRQVRDRAQNAYYLGETEVDGSTYDVVGFSMAVGPAISLYFDKETHMLRRSERVLTGFGLVEYRFNDYEVVEGIPFNKSFALYLNGDENMARTNKKTMVNVPVEKMLVAEEGLSEAPAVAADPMGQQEVADGVFLIGGNGTYAMFIEMNDYFVAVGGTAGIPERIDMLREASADKPIKYGVMTHHHFDHVLGVTAYEQEGATVVGSVAHEAVIREAAENSELLNFKGVEDRIVLEDGSRRVELIDIGPTAHTDHLVVAWLPEEGILFEADHFAMPQEGPPPPAVSSTKTFATALKEHGIRPKLIVSAHSPRPGTMEDLEGAINRDAVMVSQQ